MLGIPKVTHGPKNNIYIFVIFYVKICKLIAERLASFMDE